MNRAALIRFIQHTEHLFATAKNTINAFRFRSTLLGTIKLIAFAVVPSVEAAVARTVLWDHRANWET